MIKLTFGLFTMSVEVEGTVVHEVFSIRVCMQID